MSITKIGRVAITVPAVTRLRESRSLLFKEESPIWIVRCDVVGDDGLWPQVLVPRAEEGQQAERAERRAAQRRGHLPQEAQVAESVERARLAQLGRDGEEHLADEERAEAGGDERDHQAGERVRPAPVARPSAG